MDKIKWKYLLSRRWTILLCDLFFQGYGKPLTEYVGAQNENLLTIKQGETYSLYNSLDSLKAISRALVSKLRENENFGKQIYQDCVSASRNMVSAAQQSSRGNLESLENEIVIDRFNNYVRAVLAYSPFLAIPNNYEIFVTGEIKDFLSTKVESSDIDRYLQDLMSPKKYPFQVSEQIDLAKIALTLDGEESMVSDQLERHKEKYQWLACYNFDEGPFSITDFHERLDSLKELDATELQRQSEGLESKILENEVRFNEVVQEISLSGDLLEKTKLLREFVFLRTYRIEMNCQATFYIQPLLREIADRIGLSLKEISSMTVKEIADVVFGVQDVESIDFKDRYKAAVILLDNYEIQYVFGVEAEALISQKYSNLIQAGSADEVKGTVASKGGMVRGKVRILSKENLSEFQEGEILITVMTSPELMPAIHKAKAIITDEGGVLCHAAIVSRELSIPCIIGTKVATQTFKAGDSIEVDAEKGAVKILER